MKERQLLSHDLSALCDVDPNGPGLSINDILQHTKGRGIHLLFILLSIPFVTPVPLPGVSTAVGAIFLVLALRLTFGLSPKLPKSLGDRPLPFSKQKKVLEGSLSIIRFLEKFARPRGGFWMQNRFVHVLHGLLLAWLGCLLILPFPPFVFFTNSLPAWGVILICSCIVQEDGLLIWLGYTVTAGASVYILFILFAGPKLIYEILK